MEPKNMTAEEKERYGFFKVTSRELSVMGYHKTARNNLLYFATNGRRVVAKKERPSWR